MVLAGAGGVDHDMLVKAAHSQFGSSAASDIDAPVPTPCRFTGNLFSYYQLNI